MRGLQRLANQSVFNDSFRPQILKCFSSKAKGAELPDGLDYIQQQQHRHSHHPPGVTKLLKHYNDIPIERTRSFSIIAHIDHGKSTLSDKLLEHTHNIWPTMKGQQQVLDNLEVERERGITVKAQSASIIWNDGKEDWLFNLCDTPGHVDFAFEVRRSLAACQGALLLVDCSQGVQAQTVANYHAAKDAGLEILPVLTKIDLPSADPEPALSALQLAFGFNPESVIWTSAKTGAGIDELLPAIVKNLPPPSTGDRSNNPLQCLLFDSWYDQHRGVICLVQVVQGTIKAGDSISMASTGDRFNVQEVGLLAPARCQVPKLRAGHFGYVIAGIKDVKDARVGDTIVHSGKPTAPLSGFKPAKAMVYASLYPINSGDFSALQTAVQRLTLNDASVSVEKESSHSLGFGLRCGFLGVLHMDVFVQRLMQEFGAECIVTAPMVSYKLELTDEKIVTVERPGDFPSEHTVKTYYEPTAHVSIIAPADFLSTVLAVLESRRGVQEDLIFLNQQQQSEGGITSALLKSINSQSERKDDDAKNNSVNEDLSELSSFDEGEEYVNEDSDDESDEDEFDKSSSRSFDYSGGPATVNPTTVSADRIVFKYRLPWAEVVTGLYDQLKSATSGYASLDWSPGDYWPAKISKVDILVNGKPLDALSFIAHKDKVVSTSRKLVEKLSKTIDRQQFEIVIQAAIGTKILARSRIAPYRKDVLIKSGKVVGGGDKSRKAKLLEKQKAGKKRMKTVGNVQLSQEAFHSILSAK